MSVGFLLDTNVISKLTRPRVEPKVQAWVAAQEFGALQISVVSLGEMEKGFTTMSDLQRRARLETWLERQLLELFRGQSLPITQAIAKRWGAFEGRRQIAGRPLSVPDGMIAATAFEHDLTVVTRNAKDFEALWRDDLEPLGSGVSLLVSDHVQVVDRHRPPACIHVLVISSLWFDKIAFHRTQSREMSPVEYDHFVIPE